MRAAVLLVFGVLLLALLQIAGADTGVLNPTSYYQRYRRAEYPSDKPFYQVSDIINNNVVILIGFYKACTSIISPCSDLLSRGLLCSGGSSGCTMR